MNLMKKVKPVLFPLWDTQITVSRPAVKDDGPRVVTQLRCGACNSQAECEEHEGVWKYFPDPLDFDGGDWLCVGGGSCPDKGTGDWD
jgi:hypothetical protein